MKKTMKKLLAVLLAISILIPIAAIMSCAAITLVWPVPDSRKINQGYHSGCAIDIGDSSSGSAKVVSATSGTVTNIFKCTQQHYGSSMGSNGIKCDGFGTGVVIKGPDGRFYGYAHMKANSIPSNIYVGASVSAGQQLGNIGSTGNSSGNHLHFQITTGTYYNKDSKINPANETYTYSSSNTYTITYNANGGSGAPASQTGSTNYTISSTIPTKFGCNFKGWGELPNSSSTYSPGTNISLTGNKTLYAIWYEARDISNTLYTGGTIRYNEKNYYKFTPSISAIYTFLTVNPSNGLDTQGTIYNSSGTSLAYDDDSGENRNFSVSYSMTRGTTYYIEVKGYSSTTGDYRLHIYDSLYYDANGGSGAPEVQTGQEFYTISSVIPSRANYTFLGWSTNPSASSAEYQPGGSIQVMDPTTLYAVWRYNPPTSYTLSYNANGGSGAPSSQTGSTSYTISSTIPTRTGYTFLGWSKSSSAASAWYEPEDYISLSSNTTLYAVWQSASTFYTESSYTANISFANQERYYKFNPSSSGTYIFESTGSTDSKIYLYNSSGTVLANDDDSGNGNNFKLSYNLSSGSTYYIAIRIYSTGTGSVPFSVSKESTTPPAPTTYTLTYNANGGSDGPAAQSGSTSYYISSTRPTRSGYTFLGWSKSSSATSATYSPGEYISLSGNTTLYAVWQRNAVNNNNNIRVTIRNNPGTINLNYGETIRISADAENLPAGAKIGWFSNEGDLVNCKISSDGSYIEITATGNGTMTLYAKAVDENGNPLTNSSGNHISDVQKITVKSNIWLIIVGFFKSLFGLNKTKIQLF